MKRNIVASILGIAASVASVASSYGQGQVLFKNYGTTTFAPVQYAASSVPGGKENLYIGGTFHADLLYTYGAISGSAQNSAGSAISTLFFSIDAADQATGSGFFNGDAATVPGYTAGPVTFTVRAYNGNDYASSAVRGETTFTLSSISTGLTLPGEFGAQMTGFRVALIPEPSTLALIGLGTGALLFFRRRK
jgi:hypothetical protein